MNCKPGDIAVMVRSHLPENNGLIVEVLGRGGHDMDGTWVWLTASSRQTPVTTGGRSRFAWVRDTWLRPIRPGDISDSEVEELYRAPSLPVKEQA